MATFQACSQRIGATLHSAPKTSGADQVQMPLIIDFPDRRPDPRARSRRVRFSETSSMMIYRHPNHDEAELHYSSKEYEVMKLSNKRAIREGRSVLRVLSAGDVYHYFDCLLTGIENLSCPSTVKKLVTSRVKCRYAVLDAQARQRRSGVYDQDGLARASRRHSEWAARRAYEIGMLRSK